jgi:hypothetical protein
MAMMPNRRDFMWAAATTAGAMTVMSSEMVKAAPEQTMSLNVIYPNHEGARFDPAMADVRTDVARFTDIKPTVMLGKSV